MLKEYLTVGSDKWQQTVRTCLKIGFYSGLFIGLVILLRIL